MMKFTRFNSQDEPVASLTGELFKLKYTPGEVEEWNKRWFAIEGTKIRWYSDSHSEVARGDLELSTLTQIDMIPDDYRIILVSPGRDLILRAKSEGEMNMWHKAIDMYADLARGGDGTKGISPSRPRLIHRLHPGVHSAEFDHTSRSGKYDPDSKTVSTATETSRSDKMNDVDDGADLTYNKNEEEEDVFAGEPKALLPSNLEGRTFDEKGTRMITRNKSEMYHSQEVKYPSLDDK